MSVDHHMTIGAENGEIREKGPARLGPIAQRLAVMDLGVVPPKLTIHSKEVEAADFARQPVVVRSRHLSDR